MRMPLVSVLYGPLFARTNGYRSIPYSQNGIFLGVVTVDVKLEDSTNVYRRSDRIRWLHLCGRPKQLLPELSDKSSARNRIQATP